MVLAPDFHHRGPAAGQSAAAGGLPTIVVGSVGSIGKISDVLVAWMPLLLATAGLLVTFTAGLWNIGIEGQITLGAIFTTWVLRLLQDTSLSPTLIIILGFLAGVLGGAFWAALAGAVENLRRGE